MGRRRKAGKRTPSGRLSRAHRDIEVRDHGTAEGVRKRHLLVNGAPIEWAGSAITILQANGHVSAEQVNAAQRYRWAYSLAFGLPIPKASQAFVEPHTPRSTDRSLAKALGRFEALAGRLRRDQKAVLDQLVVDGALPGWFRRAKMGRPPTAEDEAEREALLSGLAALAE
jgi:hypothetical protein